VASSYARSLIDDYLTTPLCDSLPKGDDVCSLASAMRSGNTSPTSGGEPRPSSISRACKKTLAESISSSNSTLASFKRISRAVLRIPDPCNEATDNTFQWQSKPLDTMSSPGEEYTYMSDGNASDSGGNVELLEGAPPLSSLTQNSMMSWQTI